jgi:predicted MarR family transcription regulator
MQVLNLNTKDANNPDFIAAEQVIGQILSEAHLIVLSQPEIRMVQWKLVRDWLAAHHIDLPTK